MDIQNIVIAIIAILAFAFIIYMMFRKNIQQNKSEAVIGVVIAISIFVLFEVLSQLIHPIAGFIFFGVSVFGLIGYRIYLRVS